MSEHSDQDKATPAREQLTAFLAEHEAGGTDAENFRLFTSAMRAADETFQGAGGGGGTRHYIRDCLIPEMEKRRLVLYRHGDMEDGKVETVTDPCVRNGCGHFEDEHVLRYCTVADCDCRKFVGKQQR